MQLFDIVPSNFFSILSSPNKLLYAEALFELDKCFKLETSIYRKQYISALTERLSGLLEGDVFLDEDETLVDVKSKVNFIYNKLKDTGWIEPEFNAKDGFEEMICIPEYASRVISTLVGLTEQEQKEYRGYVYSTYSTLKEANSNSLEYSYTALNEAYKRTHEFVEELKIVDNNIRRYHRRIANQEVNELLKDHFDNYEKEVMKIIDPIKTNDSVPRFKQSILSILNSWRDDENIIERIAKLALQEKAADSSYTITDARDDVFFKIDDIINIYHNIEKTIRNIEEKHSAYTHASIERIRYKTNTTRDVKGMLAYLIANSSSDLFDKMYESTVCLSSVGFISDESKYKLYRNSTSSEIVPSKIDFFLDSPTVIDDFLEEIKKRISVDEIDAYIKSRMVDGYVDTERLNIANMDEYVLFMLSTIRAYEKDCPYKIIWRDEAIEVSEYTLPNILYSLKERG